jgi:hypothetical protein
VSQGDLGNQSPPLGKDEFHLVPLYAGGERPLKTQSWEAIEHLRERHPEDWWLSPRLIK